MSFKIPNLNHWTINETGKTGKTKIQTIKDKQTIRQNKKQSRKRPKIKPENNLDSFICDLSLPIPPELEEDVRLSNELCGISTDPSKPIEIWHIPNPGGMVNFPLYNTKPTASGNSTILTPSGDTLTILIPPQSDQKQKKEQS